MEEIKQLFKKNLHYLIIIVSRSVCRLLCRIGIIQNKIIVYVDGGICSQMHQYLIGQYYAESGFSVLYDIDWFQYDGMDVNKIHPRKFELTEMFPFLQFKIANKIINHIYQLLFKYTNLDKHLPSFEFCKHTPLYLGGYYEIPDSVFVSLFNIFLLQKPYSIPYSLNSYPNTINCAVHIRRGDMVNYGDVQDEYFSKAISEVANNANGLIRFFFFSDDIDYVEKNITPNIHVDFELIRGPHKAYEDLLLISRCDVIIASQGSFGKFAAMLNPHSILVLPDNKYELFWKNRKEDIKFIS